MSVDLLSPGRVHAGGHAHMAEASLRALLQRAVPELATGLWSLEQAQPLLTVMRRSQRFTSCSVTWTDHVQGIMKNAQLVIKQDRRCEFYWADRAARLLHQGFGVGAKSQVAAPFGVCAPGVLVCERVPEMSLLATLLAAETPSVAGWAAEQAATWVLDLQALDLDLPASNGRGLDACAPQLVEVAAVAGQAHSRELSRLAQLLQRAAHDDRAGAVQLVASHGDLHPANLFVAPGAVTAIDLDTVAAREPAYDVGYAVAHLVITPWLAGGPIQHALTASGRYWDTYRLGAGPATDRRVAVQAARALVQSLHFELVTYRTDRLDLVGPYTAGALALLDHGRVGLQVLADLAHDVSLLPAAAV